jgi:hypothetical protein
MRFSPIRSTRPALHRECCPDYSVANAVVNAAIDLVINSVIDAMIDFSTQLDSGG